MTSLQRVECILAGRKPDRPPVSFWYHFPPDQFFGPPAVKAHIDHLDGYGLDFLKVMNDNGYPHHTPIRSLADIASIGPLRGDEPEFARQIDLLASLKDALRGRVMMISTIFNAWAVLRHMIRPPSEHNPPEMDGVADDLSQQLIEYYVQDPQALRTALGTIGQNLAKFAARCIEAGADGIFLSVRDDWLDAPGATTQFYKTVVRPTDLQILSGASGGRFNMLHACGKTVDFRAFAAYPVHAINWADRAAGPSIANVASWLKPAICAGVDNLATLPSGTPEDCRQQVADALRQAGDRPIMIAPGCTYNPARVPRANLQAVRQAAKAQPYDG